MFYHYSEDPEFEKRVDDGVREAAEHVSELRDWGFSPTLKKYVWDLISESGYQVSLGGEEGAWTVEIKPENDGKFDLARAQKALDNLDLKLDVGLWHLSQNENTKDAFNLARQLCSAASSSLEKHGDFRDAVKEMGDYAVRDWNHPNQTKLKDLYRVLESYVQAREQYKDDVDSYFAGWFDDFAVWFDERIKQFHNVAGEYVDTPNAHTRWLTSQVSAWLLRPHTDMLSRGANWLIPANRIGAGWKKPWCTVVPLCISVLLFLLSVALVIGCYLFFTPTAAYGAAGLCGLLYARRYVKAREVRKERGRLTRLWHKVSALHSEVESGKYNAAEVIRRFREIEADDLLLPSIFVSVIALPEAR